MAINANPAVGKKELAVMQSAATKPALSRSAKARYYALRPWKAVDVAWRFHLGPKVFPKRAVAAFYRRLAAKRLRYPACPPKERLPIHFLAFTNAGYLDLLTENLWSLYHSWPRLPELRIVGDRGSSEAEFRSALKWWPDGWEFVPYETVEAAFSSQGRQWLTQLGRGHMMWRKASVVLYSALRGPSLYVDSDFLWRAQPHFVQGLDFKRPCILGSTDINANYSQQLLDSENRDILSPPFTCAGLLYVNGWPWPEEALRQWVVRAGSDPDYFSEQTMMAGLVRRYGQNIPLDDVFLSNADAFGLAPTMGPSTWAGRHYTNTVRHHFFRDAMLLRSGFMKPPAVAGANCGHAIKI
jgi:hypothetical protein